MDKLFIIGGNTIVGANLAVTLQDRFEILTSDFAADAFELQQAIQIQRPDWVVFCGNASRSSWDVGQATNFIDDNLAIPFAQTCAQLEIVFTMISSDAVFTGPWMSHDESSTKFNSLPNAKKIREIETQVLETGDLTQVVRANAFGFSPNDCPNGFAETMIDCLENKREVPLDFMRHTAPILATDLAELLVDCFSESVRGLVHFGTAQRTNPFQFAADVAIALDLPQPIRPTEQVLNRTAHETTLSCGHASELLDCKMPLLSDSVDRFAAQYLSGFQSQLCNKVQQPTEVV